MVRKFIKHNKRALSRFNRGRETEYIGQELLPLSAIGFTLLAGESNFTTKEKLPGFIIMTVAYFVAIILERQHNYDRCVKKMVKAYNRGIIDKKQ